MKKFEWRKLFVMSYYNWKKGMDFNPIILYADIFLLICIILFFITLIKALMLFFN